MQLIIGGAFQGKKEFAAQTYGLTEKDFFFCSGPEIDFSCRCIADLEKFTYACAGAGIDPVEYFRTRRALWQDRILILGDISAGVVPMDAQVRLWREENGRLGRYLAQQAERVSRIFCGLEQRLK